MRWLLNNVRELNNEDNYYSQKDTFTEISLCSGSIKKLIRMDLSWNDEPVELKEEQLMYRPITMYQIVCDRC